jgi:hypothetical protein
MSKLVQFVYDIYRHWEAAWLGTVSLLIATYLWATGHKGLTWGGLVAIAFVCFFIAAYQVWHEKDKELETHVRGRSYPKLFLKHVEPKSDYRELKEMSEFFVEVEGDTKAFSVRITSPDVLGVQHTRLEMLWGKVSVPVGNEPVLVSALCQMTKGTHSSSEMGSQIAAYMRMKSEHPKELIATVNYRDVDGNECPARKFRIYREHDITGHIITHCELMKS